MYSLVVLSGVTLGLTAFFVIEYVLARHLDPLVCGRGPVVFHGRLRLSRPSSPDSQSAVQEKAGLRFRSLDDGSVICIASPKGRLRTPLVITATLRWVGDAEATVEGRIPLSVVALGAWWILICVGFSLTWVGVAGNGTGVIGALLVALGFLVLFGFFWAVEYSTFRLLLRRFKDWRTSDIRCGKRGDRESRDGDATFTSPRCAMDPRTMRQAGFSRVQEILEAIRDGSSDREDLILELERFVNAPEESAGLPERFLMELADLVVDLSYYEPNPVYRAEDRAYYGNEKLIELVTAFLKRLSKT